MKIICIRHEQSETNLYRHLIDKQRLDPHLTPLGQKRAKRLYFECDLVILSNLIRTKETLLHSNIQTKSVKTYRLFREWGNDWANFQHKEYDTIHVFETKEQFKKRVSRCFRLLQKWASEYPASFTIVLINHHDFLLQLSKLISSTKYRLKNGDYFTFVL